MKYASSKGILVKTSSNLSIPLNETQLKEHRRVGLVPQHGASQSVDEQYRKRSDLELVHKIMRTIADFKEQPEGVITVGAAISTPHPFVEHFIEKHLTSFQVSESSTGGGVRGDYTDNFPGFIRLRLQWQTCREEAPSS